MTNKINAQITVTYDLDDLRNTLAELNGVDSSEVGEQELEIGLLNLIHEDFGVLSDSVYLLDENGEQVYL
jgi:hypothetical protein